MCSASSSVRTFFFKIGAGRKPTKDCGRSSGWTSTIVVLFEPIWTCKSCSRDIWDDIWDDIEHWSCNKICSRLSILSLNACSSSFSSLLSSLVRFSERLSMLRAPGFAGVTSRLEPAIKQNELLFSNLLILDTPQKVTKSRTWIVIIEFPPSQRTTVTCHQIYSSVKCQKYPKMQLIQHLAKLTKFTGPALKDTPRSPAPQKSRAVFHRNADKAPEGIQALRKTPNCIPIAWNRTCGLKLKIWNPKIPWLSMLEHGSAWFSNMFAVKLTLWGIHHIKNGEALGCSCALASWSCSSSKRLEQDTLLGLDKMVMFANCNFGHSVSMCISNGRN